MSSSSISNTLKHYKNRKFIRVTFAVSKSIKIYRKEGKKNNRRTWIKDPKICGPQYESLEDAAKKYRALIVVGTKEALLNRQTGLKHHYLLLWVKKSARVGSSLELET